MYLNICICNLHPFFATETYDTVEGGKQVAFINIIILCLSLEFVKIHKKNALNLKKLVTDILAVREAMSSTKVGEK